MIILTSNKPTNSLIFYLKKNKFDPKVKMINKT